MKQNKINKYIGLATTIIDALLIILFIVLVGLIFAKWPREAKDMFTQSSDLIDSASADSVVGGYQVLGGLGLGALGAFMVAIIIVLLILSIIGVAILLPCVIVGIVAFVNYDKKSDIAKVDAILKIVMNVIVTIFLYFGAASFSLQYAAVPSAVVVALSICQLCIKQRMQNRYAGVM